MRQTELHLTDEDRQCLDRRLPNRAALMAEADAWQQCRNADRCGIAWSLTRQDANRKMAQQTLCFVINGSLY